jgi:1-acyl-sn-glycerol-3-phosphate acyltransferase
VVSISLDADDPVEVYLSARRCPAPGVATALYVTRPGAALGEHTFIILAGIGCIVAKRAAYLWRTLRTALGFGVFGLGALMVSLCVFPLLAWAPGDRERRAQHVVHRMFRLWVWFATTLGLIRVRWHGVERLREQPPCIVVANHPSLIDIVLLIACMPQADCVVKKAAWRNPFLRGVVTGAGYIRNEGGGTLIDTCAGYVRRGRWLVLFPEGTRSPAQRLGPLHRGAAHVALRSGVPLLPVVITCDPPALMRGQKWYDVPDRVIQFTVQVGEPIAPRDAGEQLSRDSVVARRLTAELRMYYEQGLPYACA